MFLIIQLVGSVGDSIQVNHRVKISFIEIGVVARFKDDVELIEGQIREGNGGPIAVSENVISELAIALDIHIFDQGAIVFIQQLCVERWELIINHHQVVELEDEGVTVDLFIDLRK